MNFNVTEEQWNLLMYHMIAYKGGPHTHHTNSMNKMYDTGIESILKEFKTDNTDIYINKNGSVADAGIKKINIVLRVSDSNVSRPKYNNEGNMSNKQLAKPS